MAASGLKCLPLKHPQRPRSLSVIVVPDFTKDGTALEHTQAWLNAMMPPDEAQAQFFRFDYRILTKGHSIWRQLSELGEKFLRIFRQEAGTYQLMEMPLILIGRVLNIIAGVVFFGTPHPRTKEDKEWWRLTALLKLVGGLPKSFIGQSEADANAAARICEDFEQSGLEATVLTIYETKQTKVKTSVRWRLRDPVTLVDKVFAETWSKNEELLGNDVSHEGVSTFGPRSRIEQEIKLLVTSALRVQGHTMTETTSPDSAEQMELWPPSVYSDDATSRIFGAQNGSSDDANMGSSLPSNFDVIPSNDIGDYVEDEFASDTWPCYLWDGFEAQHGFVGRDDTFKAIDNCFFTPAAKQPSPEVRQLPCCCISGLGGMGKTQTAIQYANARRQEFDAIFVIRADNSAKLSEKFYKIAPALGLSDSKDKGEKSGEEADLVVNRSKALKWLSSPKFSDSALDMRVKALGTMATRELNWLLIFDNAEPSSFLGDYWPVGNVGCILVTTRDARTGDSLRSQSDITHMQSDVTHIYLDRLGTAPASKLFLQLSHRDPNEVNTKVASVIVDKLGGLPLAVEQVAAYIHGKSMALNEFLALYDRTLLEGRSSETGSHSWSYEIAASWALESLSAMASSLLRVYSFLDPDGIEDSILTNLLTEDHARTLPRGYPKEPLLHINARAELLKSSLIKVNTNASPVTVRMHRLVQDISLARMTTPQRNEVFSFVTAAVFEAWPFTENNWDHQAAVWSTQEALLQHIFRLSHIVESHDVGGLVLSLKRKFIQLLSSGGWYRQERGDFDSGIPLFELGIRMCADSPDDFLGLRADLAFGLGGANCDTNRWSEFLKHAQDQLDYRLRSDAANGISPNSNTAIAYSELGLAQALMKQYEEGVKNCDKAIRIYASQPEVIDHSFFPAFPNIHRALALVGAGRPQEGERGLLDLIAWHEARFGSGHTEFKLGYAWQCCGLIYARSGRPYASIAAYKKALEYYEATVGLLYHRTGNVCGKIAEYHESLSQFDAAE
ncbi:tetratricopeptide repeat-domain-containing protein [Aspergillus terreus]|uniref:Tetratricopeptide repeat-domain-containing protein n=1 Tax=Aspergillus terreus TaxID=33178 RepID=A0A5M3YXY0_ASPTE|nr:hypothetical protein ATETN484_0005012500 [Aspergillus terreus]GFF16790.1 tetratricopeptide repeat-domain-containing protein [Aspergillus terreus]